MAGMVCGSCGTENPAGTRFCTNCDGFLDWEGAPAGRPQPEPVAPQPVQQPQPQQPVARTAVQPAVAPPQPAPPQPAAQRPAAQPTLPIEPWAPAAPLGRTCARCGTESPAERRFCRRCGEWVVIPTAQVSTPGSRRAAQAPWWKLRRDVYQGDLTRSTLAFRVGAGIAAVVVLALLLGLFDLRPVGRVRDAAGHLLGSGRIPGVTAAAQPGQGKVTDHPPAWAVDGVRGRGWATAWVAPTAGGAPAVCTGEPVGATDTDLVLTLPAAADVREIGFEAGLAKDDPLRDGRWRPKDLVLRWTGGGCQVVTLADTPDLQRLGVEPGRVTGVRVTIASGYPPEPAGPDRLDLGEITLWHR